MSRRSAAITFDAERHESPFPRRAWERGVMRGVLNHVAFALQNL